MCDFDACPTCFDKAWRAERNKKQATSYFSDQNAENAKVPSNFDYFMRAMKQGSKHWCLFLTSALALLLSSALSLALPSFTGQILDSVYKHDEDQFKSSIKYMVAASALISLLGVAQYASISIAGRRIAASVRSDLFRSILAQDIAFFDAQMSGQLTSKLTNDVSGMVAPWSTIFNTLTSSALMLVGGLFMCLRTSWKLSALSFASVGPIIFLTSLYAKWSRKINREIYAALGDANSVATEALQNIRTVRAFSTEKNEINKFSKAVDVALNKGTKDALASAGTSTLTGFVDLATSALILGFGGWTAMEESDSHLTAGE
jgi:ABC-type multidrug transport system fused ATPase/permease subunit